MRTGVRIRLPMLRALSILGAAAFLAVVALYRPRSHAGEPLSLPQITGAKVEVDAPTLFDRRCARCHEQDGTGSSLRYTMRRLPDFTSVRWHQQRSDAQLIVSILEGKGTQMPAFSGRLSRTEARALVNHIRTFAPQEMVGITAPATHEFHERFRALEEEFERLRKQFHDLNSRNP